MMGNYHVRFGGRERRVLIEARPSRPNAELCSAFLCAHLGIVPQVRHAGYLDHWLKILKSDSRAIFHAASQASKAADFLLGLQQAPEQPSTDTTFVSSSDHQTGG